MQPDSRKLLSDALHAADTIKAFTDGKSMLDLTTDELLRSGVYWQFAIIGEALSQLQKTDAATFQRISECRRIVGFRNQIVHGYSVIDDTVTWQIIQDKLPIVHRELGSLLKER